MNPKTYPTICAYCISDITNSPDKLMLCGYKKHKYFCNMECLDAYLKKITEAGE